MSEWMLTTWSDAAMVVLSTMLIYVVVLCCVRTTGLRSLAKMSATDFLWTVASGSLLATTIVSPSPSVLLAAAAFVSVFALQWAIAVLRQRTAWVGDIIDNDPVMLMVGDQILDDNLRRVHVSRGELRAKLREANVLNLSQVRAVVMETTGDISVLHAADPDERLDQELIRDVRLHGARQSGAVAEA